MMFFISTLFSVTDCYSQWIKSSNGLSFGYVNSFAASGNNLYAGISSSGVIVTSDNGVTWTGLPGPGANVLMTNGNYIFAGTRFNVYKSTDLGTSWVGTGIPNAQPYILSLGSNGNTIFAGAQVGGIFLSSDNGGSWNHLPLNNAPVASMLVNGSQVLFGTWYHGIISSTNNGLNWGQTSMDTQSVYALAANGVCTFAGTSSGVYKSVNGGANWIQTPLNNVYVYSLAIYGNTIFAGTYFHGVYVSIDNGLSWSQRNEGFGNFQVNSLAILNDYVFAGTFGDSVYKRPLSELSGINTISEQVPAQYSLSQNYPNPFNPSTKIKIEIAKSSYVKLIVTDITGREAAVLIDQQLQAGVFEVDWNATSLSSGVYFCKLTAAQFTETRKMMLVK